MERRCTYRKAKKEDASVLALKIRDADYSELQAVHGIDVDVKKVLENAIAVSKECYVAEVNEELILMFGVSVFNEKQNVGCPWLLGTDKTFTLARELIMDGRLICNEWSKGFTYLINFVDSRNKRSIRWLNRIGFTIHEPIKFGVSQVPFNPFTMMGV